MQSSFSTNLDIDSSSSSNNSLYITNRSNINNLNNEVEIYLNKPRIPKEITIENYYNTNKNRFPILYNIARDYLAILATSTPSESTFSKINNIVIKSRNRLLSSTIKKLIILKELKVIEDKEELLNNNILFREDKTISNLTSLNLESNNNIENSNLVEEEQSLENKSTTSITNYNSSNNSTNSLEDV
jgi:hypothetical protein